MFSPCHTRWDQLVRGRTGADRRRLADLQKTRGTFPLYASLRLQVYEGLLLHTENTLPLRWGPFASDDIHLEDYGRLMEHVRHLIDRPGVSLLAAAQALHLLAAAEETRFAQLHGEELNLVRTRRRVQAQCAHVWLNKAASLSRYPLRARLGLLQYVEKYAPGVAQDEYHRGCAECLYEEALHDDAEALRCALCHLKMVLKPTYADGQRAAHMRALGDCDMPRRPSENAPHTCVEIQGDPVNIDTIVADLMGRASPFSWAAAAQNVHPLEIET